MNIDNFLKEKYVVYYNLSTGEIYSIEKLFEGIELDIESSIEVFKEVNNIIEDIGIKYFSYEEYNKIYEPELNNLYVDIKNGQLKPKSKKKNKTYILPYYFVLSKKNYSKEGKVYNGYDKFFKRKIYCLL